MHPIETIVAFCCRHARLVVLAGALAAGAAFWYTADNFAMNTNSEGLISPNLPWRQKEAEFDRLFPQRTNIVSAVIDGATAERAQGANHSPPSWPENKALFPAVRRPDGGRRSSSATACCSSLNKRCAIPRSG